MNWILIEALLCDMHWWWRAAGQAYFTWKCNSLLCHSVEIVGCIMLNNLHLLRSNLYPIFLHCMLLFAASFPKRHSLQLSTVILSNSAKAPCVSCLMHTHSQRVSLFTGKLSPLRLWVYVTFFSPPFVPHVTLLCCDLDDLITQQAAGMLDGMLIKTYDNISTTLARWAVR